MWLTNRGADSSTEVAPEASAVRSPGIEMGSGDRLRVLSPAGSSGFPQFFQSNPKTCTDFSRAYLNTFDLYTSKFTQVFSSQHFSKHFVNNVSNQSQCDFCFVFFYRSNHLNYLTTQQRNRKIVQHSSLKHNHRVFIKEVLTDPEQKKQQGTV